MSFTYDITTSVGKIRLEIGDISDATGEGIKPDGSNFTDEELMHFMSLVDTWQQAAVKALRVLASMYASKARFVSVADVKEDYRATAQAIRDQADALEAQLDADGTYTTGGVATATLDLSGSFYSVDTDGNIS